MTVTTSSLFGPGRRVDDVVTVRDMRWGFGDIGAPLPCVTDDFSSYTQGPNEQLDDVGVPPWQVDSSMGEPFVVANPESGIRFRPASSDNIFGNVSRSDCGNNLNWLVSMRLVLTETSSTSNGTRPIAALSARNQGSNAAWWVGYRPLFTNPGGAETGEIFIGSKSPSGSANFHDTTSFTMSVGDILSLRITGSSPTLVESLVNGSVVSSFSGGISDGSQSVGRPGIMYPSASNSAGFFDSRHNWTDWSATIL